VSSPVSAYFSWNGWSTPAGAAAGAVPPRRSTAERSLAFTVSANVLPFIPSPV
jgi:hypothetical protein